MIEIDGSRGEGGGQILRSSLSLSLITGKPFHIRNIRGNRKKPGLMRQHLTAVLAASEVGDAKTKGARAGSTDLTFEPGTVKAGKYDFAVGTAGSTTLVLQTLLPALMCEKSSSTLRISGGTHNPLAPSFDFLERAFLPLLRTIGVEVRCHLERPGFYPAGGGVITAEIHPAVSLTPLSLNFRGALRRTWAHAAVSCLPGHIGKRELQVIQEKLGLDSTMLHLKHFKENYGPGNVVTIGVENEHLTEVFYDFGEKGQRAEEVAERVTNLALEYLNSTAPVGKYLADQLLLPLALAGGGEFETCAPTPHFHSNVEIIERFLPIAVETTQLENNRYRVTVARNP